MFLVFEGLDGSGGTTQLRLLSTALQHLPEPPEVVCTTEPSPGPLGKLIREVLTQRALSENVLPYLFTADRRDHLDRVVLPGLARGAVVLSDRYLLSSLAYQSAVLPMERVDILNSDFPPPDILLYLDVPVEECLQRIERRGMIREIFETRERLLTIDAAYQKALQLRTRRGDRILKLDGTGDPLTVHERVVTALQSEGLWPG
jgi:dTMP kinase